MKTFLKLGLMAPDAGAPGGGDTAGNTTTTEAPSGPKAVFEPVPITKTEPEKPVATTEPVKPAGETSTTEPAKPVATPAGVVMSEEQLQKLASTLAASVKPAAAPTQPDKIEPLTPEQQAEFDKEFNVVRVTPELFQSILGFAPENPAQLKAFETFAHGIVRQAAAMTLYRVNGMFTEREGKLRESLNPIMTAHQSAVAAKTEASFFEKYPDLKDFGPLVAEVAVAEKARGTKFESPEKAFEAVANKARALLGNRAPAGGTTQGANTNRPAKPSMPSVSTGGRSGGNISSQQAPASGPKAVFGDLDGGR